MYAVCMNVHMYACYAVLYSSLLYYFTYVCCTVCSVLHICVVYAVNAVLCDAGTLTYPMEAVLLLSIF